MLFILLRDERALLQRPVYPDISIGSDPLLTPNFLREPKFVMATESLSAGDVDLAVRLDATTADCKFVSNVERVPLADFASENT